MPSSLFSIPWEYNGIQNYNYNSLMNQYNNYGQQLTAAMNAGQNTAGIMSSMDTISSQLAGLEDLASMFGKSPDQMSPVEMQLAQNYMNNSTGITGWVNNNFGGWGNVFSGLQGIGNLYMGLQNLSMAEDALGMQQDAFNFNKQLSSQNYANQAKAYNAAVEDRLRARAFTETGNANAYDQQIEERKVKPTL